ncbi:putative sialic acid transporter [Candidatus Methanobinarius endosymbioticus]|uniref:Putative sialic acid transporter n=1 Tax=Candidatus Methanobinarius endosymbioticus TaxID=2006182 RepID=A0A366M9T1_9EURY|nr:putative sialic acid transporter [Candidatus Methanobinarius endosymbioticus]
MINYKHLYWITFIVMTVGIVCGLNIAGISGAVSSIQDIFNLNDTRFGIIVSSLTIGCIIGSLILGYLSERYGRRKTLILTSILFIISSLGCALSNSTLSLIFYRFIGGLAVGTISFLGPMYISEIAPPKIRGRLVSLNQFAIVIGILLAYIFDYFLLGTINSWRYMLIIPLIFSILCMILSIKSLPESPRWLTLNNKKSEAKSIFEKIEGKELIKEDINNIEKSSSMKNKIFYKNFFRGNDKKIILIGLVLAIFQQIVGINAVITYAPMIFKNIGIQSQSALLQSIIIGLVNFLATIIALWLIDKKGRKILLICGALGMTITLSYLAFAFRFSQNSILILIAILMYVTFYAASFAPILGVITSETFSNNFRGIAMSITSAINWLSAFMIVQFSPYILNNLGGNILFGIFAVFSLLALIFVKIYIPETKNKSLEEIEKELTS